jgi:outer membrane protein OmpA-like peptidoglycan-associated protein
MSLWNRGLAAGLLLAALGIAGATAAFAQDAETVEVLDLTLPILDLETETSSLDQSVRRTESEQEIRVALDTDVLFRFDSAALTAKAGGRIDQAVAEIEAVDPASVTVTGHTDSRGSNAYNRRLSLRRAEAVRQALAGQLGSDAPRFEVAGKGESKPVAANQNKDGSDNPRGRARNRRVEIGIPRG